MFICHFSYYKLILCFQLRREKLVPQFIYLFLQEAFTGILKYASAMLDTVAVNIRHTFFSKLTCNRRNISKVSKSKCYHCCGENPCRIWGFIVKGKENSVMDGNQRLQKVTEVSEICII